MQRIAWFCDRRGVKEARCEKEGARDANIQISVEVVSRARLSSWAHTHTSIGVTGEVTDQQSMISRRDASPQNKLRRGGG